MIQKDDLVTLADGRTGAVIEVWGVARLFARVRLDASGKLIPVMASSIISYKRPVKVPKWGGEPREKREKSNAQAKVGDQIAQSQPEQLACL